MSYRDSAFLQGIRKILREDLDEGPQLPELPRDILEWIRDARPLVDGYHRHLEFLPLWEDIYNDNHWNIMILAGRQIFKSTFCTDILAHEVTTKSNVQAVYLVDDENRLHVPICLCKMWT
jgi:hypothetical protein